MNGHPFVSIIILNFNGKQWLKECFTSLENLNYPKDCYEVIMGDNASTDDSVEWTRQNFPWVRIIQFEKNGGFCWPNNRCAEQAKGEYLVFLNNDTFVTRDWLSNLVKGVLSEEGMVSCASKILFPHLEGGKILNAAGGIISLAGGGLYEGWMDEDSPAYNIQKYTGFGCGAGVLVQKKFFLETGGFDEYYFYSVEEADLGFRAWLYGYKVLYVPSAVMYHYMGRTGFRGRGMTPTIYFLVVRNGLYFILKNFETITALKGVILFHCQAVYNVFIALLQGNIVIPFQILKAYLSCLLDLKRILEARKRIQANRKITDGELYRKGVLMNVTQTIKRSFLSGRRTRKRSAGKGYFDTKDSVRICIDDDGDMIFYKP